MNDFKATLTLSADLGQVYNGLTQSIPKWWSEIFIGSAQEVGHTFTIYFGSQVFKTILVKELIRDQKVAWQVVDALIDLPELANKKEWIGTSIVWDIASTDGGVSLHLTHLGLTPEVECYQVCIGGWQSFLYSLEKYLATGEGSPFRSADAG